MYRTILVLVATGISLVLAFALLAVSGALLVLGFFASNIFHVIFALVCILLVTALLKATTFLVNQEKARLNIV